MSISTRPEELNGQQGAIAVIGMAGRFRDAPNVDRLWALIREGKQALYRLSDEELAQSGCPEFLRRHVHHVPVTAQLNEADRFDAEFFGFSRAEALNMDPQLRIMLETAWQAFENAGKPPDAANYGMTGVFSGAAPNLYWQFNSSPGVMEHLGAAFNQGLILNDPGFYSMWISSKLNLSGPSLNIATACSTGLVAIASGCQSLLDYSCDTALIVTASVCSPRNWGYLAEPGGILSPSGIVRPFDVAADGTVLGEGVCALLLKRAEDAFEQGLRVRALIRGYALNNDGARKAGFTAPSAAGQTEVIRMAHHAAGVDSRDVSYVETHGTGTYLGDPVEFEGLCRAFALERETPCYLGSLKANMGHLNISAGTTALIKTVLMMEHERIPPLVNFTACNKEIPLSGSAFAISARGLDWNASGPRIAGISSFGFGGTNCHLVVQEAPGNRVPDQAGPSPCDAPLFLSAPDEPGLVRQAEALGHFFANNPDADTGRVALTLREERRHFAFRAACSGKSPNETAKRLLSGRYKTGRVGEEGSLVALLPDYSHLTPEKCDMAMGTIDFLASGRDKGLSRSSGTSPAETLAQAIAGLLAATGLPFTAVAGDGAGRAGAVRLSALSAGRSRSGQNRTCLCLESIAPSPHGPQYCPHWGVDALVRAAGEFRPVFLQCALFPELVSPAGIAGYGDGPSVVFLLQDGVDSANSAWSTLLEDLYLLGFVESTPYSPMLQSVRLPGYIFARDIYWLPLKGESLSLQDSQTRPELAGSTPVETLLLEIWATALGRPDITMLDDFFLLGGTSMTAIQILSAIELQLGLSLSMADFMRARTIKNLIPVLAQAAEEPRE